MLLDLQLLWEGMSAALLVGPGPGLQMGTPGSTGLDPAALGFDWGAFALAALGLLVQVLVWLIPAGLWAAVGVMWVWRAGYRRGVAAAANQPSQGAGNW